MESAMATTVPCNKVGQSVVVFPIISVMYDKPSVGAALLATKAISFFDLILNPFYPSMSIMARMSISGYRYRKYRRQPWLN